jgi:DNA-binding response OmpR family regulator
MEKEQKTRILVIEDDPDVLAMLIKHLEYLDYAVITATDGMEGLKQLQSAKYDLVITDIVMPYVSGVGVVTALKEEAAAVEKKADLVLAKPVKMSTLKGYIEQLLTARDKT